MSIPLRDFNNIPYDISTEEIVFTAAFIDYMKDNQCEGIGGAVIACLCSPYGHCYNMHASSFSWDKIILGQDDSVELEKVRKTGIRHFEYHVPSTSERGQAIVGFYLDQAKVGYIYDPIHYDEAVKVENTDLSSFSKLINDTGKLLSMNSRHNKKMQPTDECVG